MLFSRSKKTQNIIHSLQYDRCYAKTDEKGRAGINVKQHLLNVAAVCHVLQQQLPLSLQEDGGFAKKSAAVHDVGKVSPGFQLKYFRDSLVKSLPEFSDKVYSQFSTDHSHIGACALWAYAGAEDPFHCPAIAQIVAMHHGSVRVAPAPDDTVNPLGGKAWSEQRKQLIQEMETLYGSLDFTFMSTAQRDFIAGMVTISDWIGSDETFFPPHGFPDRTDLNAVARNAVSACGLCTPELIAGLSFEDIFGFPPFDIQEQFGNLVNKPGIYVLEAPMGVGKTEAALYAAYLLMSKGLNQGLFFGLPTRLTSDRIHKRIDAFLKKICTPVTTARLAHGTAWLKFFENDGSDALRLFEHGGEELSPGNSWFNPRKRALLHPFVVGTIDQALMSILRVKHHFVRTFGLAGKVVILDEVHSYDGYTGTLIENMASQLTTLGCSVIILSATLTGERRFAFFSKLHKAPESPNLQRSSGSDFSNAYPLITGKTINGKFFSEPAAAPAGLSYAVCVEAISDIALAKRAVEKAMGAHCVLCIANTVAKAQAWYDAVSAEAPEGVFPIGLLHSKFPGFQRSKIENIWMERLGKENDGDQQKKNRRPDGCILIATQVVEQSVDIDADYLITEIAPTDMLLQRMGREWRHLRENRPCIMPEVLIISGDPTDSDSIEGVYDAFGKSNCKVYAPWILWRTWQVWGNLIKVELPADIRILLEATYDGQGKESEVSSLVEELYEHFKSMRDSLACKAEANLSTVTSMPVWDDHDACATRYSDLPTTQALLVKEIDNTGDEAELTLLSGERVSVNRFQPNMAVTAKLHLNLINVPTWLISRIDVPETPLFLTKHFYETTPVLLWDEISSEITMNSRHSDFKYTPMKGLFREAPVISHEPETFNELENREKIHDIYLSDYEDIDVFDKSRFDW